MIGTLARPAVLAGQPKVEYGRKPSILISCSTFPKSYRPKRGQKTKPWIKYPVDQHGRFIYQMSDFYLGDKVIITKGKDEGKVGEVIFIDLVTLWCKVEGCQKVWKKIPSQDPSRNNDRLRVEDEMPCENAKLYDEENECATEVKHIKLPNGVYARQMETSGKFVFPRWYQQYCKWLGVDPADDPALQDMKDVKVIDKGANKDLADVVWDPQLKPANAKVRSFVDN